MSRLDRIIEKLGRVNEGAGRALGWALLAMVLIQFGIVILRYVFSVSFIALQESVLYLHGLVFLLGAGFTLLHEGHVRVDIFYRDAAPRRRAGVDLAGSLLLLLPFCVAIIWLSSGYIINSWSVFEGSPEVSGLPLVFLLKSAIWIFAGLLFLQGLALALGALRCLLGGADYAAGSK